MRLKSWTKTTLSALAAFASVLCACGRTEPVVWVDVRRAGAQLYATASEPTGFVSRVSGLPPAAGAIPEREPSTLGARDAERRRTEALELMALESARLRQALEDAYLRELTEKVKVTERDLLLELRKVIRERADQVVETVWSWIQESALARGPMAARYAFLSGAAYKPRPIENVPADAGANYEQRRRKELADLARSIAQHDQEFESRLQELLDRTNSESEAERTAVLARIQAAYVEAARTAERLALARIQETGRVDLPPLLDLSSRDVPPLPSSKVEFDAVVSEVFSGGLTPLPRRYQEEIQTQLDIWLRVHGYKLARRSGDAPDLTVEFINWVRMRQAGP